MQLRRIRRFPACLAGVLVLALATSSTSSTVIPNTVITVGSTTIAGGADKGILYQNGTKLGQDPTRFVYDQSTGFMGIGVSAPVFPLDVATNGASYFQSTSYRNAQFGGGIFINHARGTQAVPLSSNAGDIAGAIFYQLLNPDMNFYEIGEIRAQGSGTPFVGGAYGALQFAVNSGADRAMIIQGGQVVNGGPVKTFTGIGAAVPAATLDVADIATGQTATSKVLQVSFPNIVGFNTTSGPLTSYAGYFSSMSTKTGANSLTNVGLYADAAGADFNYAAVFGSGNVGIGTTTPGVPLDVVGDIRTNTKLVLSGNVTIPILFAKITAGATAPTAGNCTMRWEAGTNSGTGKLVGYCGTSSTGVTIIDNVGAGF